VYKFSREFIFTSSENLHFARIYFREYGLLRIFARIYFREADHQIRYQTKVKWT